MNIKRIILACFVLFSVSISAQYRSEISVDVFGGLSSFNYKPELGDQKQGLGGGAGVGYRYLINKKAGLGIQTGVNVALLNAKTELNGVSNSFTAFDGLNNEYFQFIYALSAMEEKQQAFMVNIPLMLYWETGYNDRFYLAVGGKVGIPLKSTYKIEDASLQTAGYYESIDILYDDIPYAGFGTFNLSTDGDLKLKPSFMASFEMGMKWRIATRYSIATSIYVDYGINNVIKNKTYHNFIDYNTDNPSDFKLHGIFASQYLNNNNEVVKVAEKMVPLTVGIKISFLIGSGEKYRRDYIQDWLWPR